MSPLRRISVRAGRSVASLADAHPQGSWLLVTRLGWIALTLLILALNLAMIPSYNAILQAPCHPGATCVGIQLTGYDRQLLHQLHLSLAFVAGYQVILDTILVLVYCALGALLFWRRSDNRMALFCAYMLVLFAGTSFTSILQDTLWLASTAWFVLLGILDVLGQSTFLIFFLLFPSGRFVPRWTRWLAALIVPYWVVDIFIINGPYNKNGDTAVNLVFFALLICVVGAQIYRYRRVSTPGERQQTKWVVYGFASGIIGFVLLVGIGNLVLPPYVLQSAVTGVLVADTALYGFLLLVPISISIAILRSRLYDIDVIINRTLVYGSLTAILGVLYTGLIIGLESLAEVLTGASNRPVVLVISTLAIAALFQPVRRRLQSTIDRRFYRRKFDAQKTLEAFSATLRQETDLEQLQAQLLATIQETMQPEHIALWLRAPDQFGTRPTAPGN